MADSRFRSIGTPRIAHELAVHLLEQGHEAFAVTDGTRISEDNSRPYPIKIVGPHFSLGSLPKFASLVRDKCDLIHFHGGEQLSYFAKLLRVFSPIPLVFTFTFIPSIFRKTMPPQTRLMLSHLSQISRRIGSKFRVDHSIALSEFARKRLILDEGIDPSNISVVRYGISEDYLSSTISGTEVRGLVGCTTGPSNARGFHDFLESVPLTRIKHPQARFVALARDNLELAAFHRISPPGLEVMAPRYFLNAITPVSVVVMPFRTHAAIDPPLSLLESMATGKAIVTTPIGSIPEVMDNGRGQIVSTQSPLGIANATSQFLENDSLRNGAAEAALDYTRKTYDWKEAISRMTTVYQRVYH